MIAALGASRSNTDAPSRARPLAVDSLARAVFAQRIPPAKGNPRKTKQDWTQSTAFNSLSVKRNWYTPLLY
ncbi:hypothetical protein AWB69_07162 [Caballeronia udeis]|uniref:Uncharacterized protein n=1 Tax=Caballeronia udeis TaxID=1232866 RepID=A0A158J614_9BURK|nr:hypothetical protein AWB69_07162 [Caballeronia udeis]